MATLRRSRIQTLKTPSEMMRLLLKSGMPLLELQPHSRRLLQGRRLLQVAAAL
jgi:hypothetical protein